MFKLGLRHDLMGYPRNDMVLGFSRSQVKVRVKVTAIRRLFELCECLVVTTVVIAIVVVVVVVVVVSCTFFNDVIVTCRQL